MTTAVGGGMIRDLILGVNPPVMFQNPTYALIAIAFSVLIFCGLYFFQNKLTEHKEIQTPLSLSLNDSQFSVRQGG
jgi:uncharacterized membrane protein YeiH